MAAMVSSGNSSARSIPAISAPSPPATGATVTLSSSIVILPPSPKATRWSAFTRSLALPRGRTPDRH